MLSTAKVVTDARSLPSWSEARNEIVGKTMHRPGVGRVLHPVSLRGVEEAAVDADRLPA